MSAGLECEPSLTFDLPDELAAGGPVELAGGERDDARLLVASPDGLTRTTVRGLADALEPGDLVVLNMSETLPAALPGRTADGEQVAVHLSTVRPGPGRTPARALAQRASSWVVELRRPEGIASAASYSDRSGTVVTLPAGGRLRVRSAHPAGRTRARLWVADLDTPAPLGDYLERNGEPIRYPHVREPWPMAAYRTPFATTPGSAEMPSAGRGLTDRVLLSLALRGVQTASLLLHCGVSSLESGDPPYAEWFSVPAATADAVNRAHDEGRRVIAVGTTVVRALESAVREGRVAALAGWTELMITPDRRVSTVDGLLTGWHEPAATHLLMLEAIAGRELLCESYRVALDEGYRWHEFGDLNLLLPHRQPRSSPPTRQTRSARLLAGTSTSS